MLTKLTPKEQLSLALELLDDMSTKQEEATAAERNANLLPTLFVTYALSKIALQGIDIENGVIKGAEENIFSQVRTNLCQVRELLDSERIQTDISSRQVCVYIRKKGESRTDILARLSANATTLDIEVQSFDYYAHSSSEYQGMSFFTSFFTQNNGFGRSELVLNITIIVNPDDEDVNLFIFPEGRVQIKDSFNHWIRSPREINLNWKNNAPQVIPAITLRDEDNAPPRKIGDRSKAIQAVLSLVLSPHISRMIQTLFGGLEKL